VDEQLLRAGRQGRQTASGRLRVLAHNRTLARWCRIRSYLDSAANHGLTALDAITRALDGKPLAPGTSPLNQSPKPLLTGIP
jgi:hypothetical protein